MLVDWIYEWRESAHYNSLCSGMSGGDGDSDGSATIQRELDVFLFELMKLIFTQIHSVLSFSAFQSLCARAFWKSKHVWDTYFFFLVCYLFFCMCFFLHITLLHLYLWSFASFNFWTLSSLTNPGESVSLKRQMQYHTIHIQINNYIRMAQRRCTLSSSSSYFPCTYRDQSDNIFFWCMMHGILLFKFKTLQNQYQTFFIFF